MSVTMTQIHVPAAFLIDREAAAHIQLRRFQAMAHELPFAIKGPLDSGKFNSMAYAEQLPGQYSRVKEAFEVLKNGLYASVVYSAQNLIKPEFYHQFSGRINSLLPDQCHEPMADRAYNGELCFIPCANAISLFHAAYDTPDDILKEFKFELEQYMATVYDQDRPFDYWAHIVDIHGVYLLDHTEEE